MYYYSIICVLESTAVTPATATSTSDNGGHTSRRKTFYELIDKLSYHKKRDEYQSLKLSLRQPWVQNVSDFSFLTSAMRWWRVISFPVSPSHTQPTVIVDLLISDLAKGTGGDVSNKMSALAGISTSKLLTDIPKR